MLFDPGLPIELHTDASSEGYGAILFQRTEAKLYLVEYYSKRTTDAESRYHSYELETLAVVTDCNSLKASKAKVDLNP